VLTLAAVHDAWLFTRGADSVRIIRTSDVSGAIRLVVRGSGYGDRSYEVADLLDCTILQSDVERELVADGFILDHFGSDRRRLPDRRSRSRGPDRRRGLRAVTATRPRLRG
jgi:hypothetical protein